MVCKTVHKQLKNFNNIILYYLRIYKIYTNGVHENGIKNPSQRLLSLALSHSDSLNLFVDVDIQKCVVAEQ